MKEFGVIKMDDGGSLAPVTAEAQLGTTERDRSTSGLNFLFHSQNTKHLRRVKTEATLPSLNGEKGAEKELETAGTGENNDKSNTKRFS